MPLLDVDTLEVPDKTTIKSFTQEFMIRQAPSFTQQHVSALKTLDTWNTVRTLTRADIMIREPVFDRVLHVFSWETQFIRHLHHNYSRHTSLHRDFPWATANHIPPFLHSKEEGENTLPIYHDLFVNVGRFAQQRRRGRPRNREWNGVYSRDQA
ncbi:hypothetical protein PAAG_11142 [Paracoccidioides lutzii Pb01]|uniref:Uncharacterized protein n=1 Tax=Paracoccidioides lutzii (strain ATCC MYA-826 / Pb01) TaxID=502779 RepID=A0A0A2V363_PARBA|nr:hypothetical protein PAAG_11142 [Paracoccidioides lutzii Pb01]KGQ02186.1 hypothetical protein PAAG_11142 [Paracoccidioides lutzii Pb01]